MDLSPNDLLLFARVVDEGSFSRAAERLSVPKSTVSRRVAALEAELGERLLLRTTRKLTVTDFGLAVLEHARHVVEDVTAAASLAHNRQIEPSGRLRVTMPGDFANLVLAPLLAAGVGSVVYWRWTDLAGRDDLRLYGIVQFGSLALVLALCLLLTSRYTRGGDMFAVIAFYVVAKLFEGLDRQILRVGGFISGHTLKHLAAAIACYLVLRMLMLRRPSTA